MNDNPYSGHRLLSEKEQEILGEYARLAGTIRRVSGMKERKARKMINHSINTNRLSICPIDSLPVKNMNSFYKIYEYWNERWDWY